VNVLSYQEASVPPFDDDDFAGHAPTIELKDTRHGSERKAENDEVSASRGGRKLLADG
jgi:hypothetical protein